LRKNSQQKPFLPRRMRAQHTSSTGARNSFVYYVRARWRGHLGRMRSHSLSRWSPMELFLPRLFHENVFRLSRNCTPYLLWFKVYLQPPICTGFNLLFRSCRVKRARSKSTPSNQKLLIIYFACAPSRAKIINTWSRCLEATRKGARSRCRLWRRASASHPLV
jgi:hypothetical protein